MGKSDLNRDRRWERTSFVRTAPPRRDSHSSKPVVAMNASLSRALFTFVVGVLLARNTVRAQAPIPKSQLAVVTQYVAGTKIEITYRRPVARGRAIFGALVPYGRVWSPSSDTA